MRKNLAYLTCQPEDLLKGLSDIWMMSNKRFLQNALRLQMTCKHLGITYDIIFNVFKTSGRLSKDLLDIVEKVKTLDLRLLTDKEMHHIWFSIKHIFDNHSLSLSLSKDMIKEKREMLVHLVDNLKQNEKKTILKLQLNVDKHIKILKKDAIKHFGLKISDLRHIKKTGCLDEVIDIVHDTFINSHALNDVKRQREKARDEDVMRERLYSRYTIEARQCILSYLRLLKMNIQYMRMHQTYKNAWYHRLDIYLNSCSFNLHADLIHIWNDVWKSLDKILYRKNAKRVDVLENEAFQHFMTWTINVQKRMNYISFLIPIVQHYLECIQSDTLFILTYILRGSDEDKMKIEELKLHI